MEQFENISGNSVLTDFRFESSEPEFPTQCKSASVSANSYILQYDPTNTQVMASTVPATHIDEFIGNIGAFDQFALMVNFKDSNSTLSVVQAKRFKTNNEEVLQFNYKAVLQSIIDDSAHDDNQPYFKARIINQSGQVVSEFCLVGDRYNCIFSQADHLEASHIVLYTKNWQAGSLDISAIPNNQPFTVEFMAARCGLSAHFGYAYIDDICLIHSDENTQGSIILDPLNKICPTLPVSVCGNYSLPTSGGVSATVTAIEMKVYDATNAVVYTTTTTSSHDTANHTFCFNIDAANLPNIATGTYNVGVKITYGVNQTDCPGTQFALATDNDANPGWDIWFLNCNADCTLPLLPGKLELCDSGNGKATFNLHNAELQVAGNQNGLTYSFFKTLSDATANTALIPNAGAYESASDVIFIRVTKNPTCYKIIAVELVVKHPSFTISGILNVCSGSTVLTASPGSSYMWSTGAATQSVTVNTTGTYSVTVSDANGCSGVASATILPNQVAVQATLTVLQPSCSISTGTITITSTVSECSFDNGVTWTTNTSKSNLTAGIYMIKVKTAAGCISYSTAVTIYDFLLTFPDYTSIDPTVCGGLGSITITDASATQFSFDDGVTWTTNPTKTNLPSGVYKIRVKNASGCISNFNSVILNSEFLPAAIYTSSPPVCGIGGTITITTPATEYSFDGGTTWVTNNVLQNVVSGSYIIKIKNALGCTSASEYVYIDDFNEMYPDYTTIDPTCGADGTITFNLTGDFQYSYDGGTTWSNSPTSNLPAGSYQLKIKNAQGCMSRTNYAYLNAFHLPYPNYTTVPPSCGNGGTITITDIADFYSFDGGLTWGTSPISPPLPEDYYEIMVKNNTGCTSYENYVYLYEVFLPYPEYVITQPTCSNKGSITITTITAQYSFDNGATWGTSAILSNLDPGSYTIMIKDANGCTSEGSYVYLYQPHLDDPVFNIVHPFCLETTGTITITAVAGFEYSFDDGDTYQSNNFSGPLLPGYHYLKVRNNTGCESDTQYAYINQPSGIPNTPIGDTAQFYCIFNNPNVGFLQAEGENIQWFDTPVSTLPLSLDLPLIDGEIYYASQTVAGCESPVRLATTVTLSNYVTPAGDHSALVCDDLNNGSEQVDLKDYNQILITDNSDVNDYTFSYYHTFDGAENKVSSDIINNIQSLATTSIIYYVRVVSPNGCYKVAALTLNLIPSPYLSMENKYILCEGSHIHVIADQFYDGYLWSNGSTESNIRVTTPGNYWVIVSEDHGTVVCTTKMDIQVVLSNPAVISQTITADWTMNDNTITVLLSSDSLGDYEFSLDNVHFQDDNEFTGLSTGKHEVFVRDKNGCGTTSTEVYLLMYKNFFTPNGDGFNDFWNIDFSIFEQSIELRIYDRYGKFLKQLFGEDKGWDGTFNGKDVISDDYWFLVTRADGREYRGHFTLKR
ncbi:MAG: T9SS type B sorting domain-containing protein [Flavobacterium sp.]|nr:T9SS type B sorting domain-containing protein [Flavobacterium sp.]